MGYLKATYVEKQQECYLIYSWGNKSFYTISTKGKEIVRLDFELAY